MLGVNLLLASAVVAIPVFGCAMGHDKGITAWRYLKKTFAPTTIKEFLFPPCPLCWAVRGLAVAGLAFILLPQA